MSYPRYINAFFFVFGSTFICHPGICLKSLILYYGGLTGQEMLSGNDEGKENGVGEKQDMSGFEFAS